MSKLVYLDTETNALAPGQIGQLSIIIEEDGTIRAKNYFMKIDYMTDGAMEVTHRDKEFYDKVSNGKTFKDYADDIENELSDATLIAHNLKFDENFISSEFWRINKVFKPYERFCTMNYFAPIMNIPGGKYGKPKNPKLSELVEYFNIDEKKVLSYAKQLFNTGDELTYHDAMYDTTSMFIAVHIYKERLEQSNNDWTSKFCKE